MTGSVSDPVTLHGDRAYWHWTDLKIGSVIDLHAKRYHICSTDEFTRDYLESEGISMKDKEVRFMKFINHRTSRLPICRWILPWKIGFSEKIPIQTPCSVYDYT